MKPKWISKKALLLLHEESLSEFGGGRGFVDEGMLDSALARPQNLYAYNPRTAIMRLAAACAYGIARNHPLVDGNKRLAFLSIGLMLGINDYKLKADKVDAVRTMLALAAGEVDEDQLSDWIKRNSKSLKQKSK